MEVIVLVGLAAFGWYVWKFGKVKPTPQKKTEPPPLIRPAVDPAALDKAPAPAAARQAVSSPAGDDTHDQGPPVVGDKSTGRRALREMCRNALSDKAISYSEALLLLQAFEAYCGQFPNTSTHVDYLRHQLFLAIEDGHIDPSESQELVTLLGEFADYGLYVPPPPAPAVEPSDPPKKRTRSTTPRKAPAPRNSTPTLRTPVEMDGRYLMTYTDAEGEISQREIKPKRIEHRGEHAYLVAYCLKARAPRTFRVDRIESLVDAETGEIMPI